MCYTHVYICLGMHTFVHMCGGHRWALCVFYHFPPYIFETVELLLDKPKPKFSIPHEPHKVAFCLPGTSLSPPQRLTISDKGIWFQINANSLYQLKAPILLTAI